MKCCSLNKINFPCSFPCPFENCKKEYRTQWELNSHQKLKHTKSITDIDQISGNSTQIVLNDSEMNDLIGNDSVKRSHDDQTQSTSLSDKTINNRKKRKNNQQIIYVMPGPIENVSFIYESLLTY